MWAQVADTPPITTLEETLGKLRFGPDGCGLDAEEHIWSADEVNARCARVAGAARSSPRSRCPRD